MKNASAKNKILALALLAATSMTGCSFNKPYLREETADRLASPAWMVKREIPAGAFALRAYERMHTRFAPADIYIEGDGKAWVSKTRVSLDPTPDNPVALHLATRDLADNVAWLARPCQFTRLLEGESGPCDPAYWTDKKFAPEVLAAYNEALDEIRKRYDIEGFNLIGYSGGGAIASLLAAQRGDVLSVRTVAGNLDHEAHSKHHQVSPLNGSLNPPDFAGKLAFVPQVHFIGGQDEIVPPAILHSYLQELGPTNCVQYRFIQEAQHDKGWVDKWPEFLNVKPVCSGVVERVDLDIPAPLLPSLPDSFTPKP